MYFKKFFVCILTLSGTQLFSADDAAVLSVASAKEGERSNALWEAFKQSEYYALYKTSSDEKEDVQEDEKEAHAERNVSSSGSGSEGPHSFLNHSITPPLPTTGASAITSNSNVEVDSFVLQQVSRFSLSASAVHSAFVHVLEEQQRQGSVIAGLTTYMRELAKMIEKIEMRVRCVEVQCRQYTRDYVSSLDQKNDLEFYRMHRRINVLEGQVHQIEEHMHRIDLKAARIPLEQTLVQHERFSSSNSDLHCSGGSGSELTKNEPTTSSSSKSSNDSDMSPFSLTPQELPNDDSAHAIITLEIIPTFDLDAQQSAQKLLEEARDTTV